MYRYFEPFNFRTSLGDMYNNAVQGSNLVSALRPLLLDPAVTAAFEKLVGEVVQRNWRIEAANAGLTDDEKDKAKEIANFVHNCLEHIGLGSPLGYQKDVTPGTGFNGLCKALLEAIIISITFAELTWEIKKNGDKWEIIPTAVNIRDSAYLSTSVDGRNLLYNSMPLLPRSAIIHRYWTTNYHFALGYGLGIQLRPLVKYRMAELTNWMSHGDKYTTPTLLAKYPQGTTEAELVELDNALDQISRKTFIAVGQDIEIDWMDTNASPDTYRLLLEYCDELISFLICGETTVGKEGVGGSRSRDVIADSVRVRKAKLVSDGLNETLNSTLIHWIVSLNYGQEAATKYRPKIVREFEDLETDLAPETIVSLVSQLSQMGFQVDIEWLSRILDMPLTEQTQEEEFADAAQFTGQQ